MTAWDKEREICSDCVCWTRISDADGGVGICDNTISDHNQHVVGYAHQACDMGIIEEEAEATDAEALLVEDGCAADAEIGRLQMALDRLVSDGSAIVRGLRWAGDHNLALHTRHNIEAIAALSSGRPLGNNLRFGVSVENQGTADERIPLLLQIPAAARFVSCELLLGAVDSEEEA